MKKTLTAEELDAYAETGKSLVPYMKLETVRRIHGGARKGAGRKPAGKVQYVTRLRPEVIAQLKKEAKRLDRAECDVVDEMLARVLLY
jgi:hypothetical protein